MRFLAILSLCLMNYILQSSAQAAASSSSSATCRTTGLPWCHSCNDPHMRTFDGTNYEFQFSGNFFVMYTNYLDTRVTASFQRCNANRVTPTCNCGVHIRFRGVMLALDTCGTIPSGPLQFYATQSPFPNPRVAECSSKTVPAGKETDDGWWNTDGNAYNVFDKILCAKHQTQHDTYIIRTNDKQNNGKNIYVKLALHCRGISCIYIRPAGCDFGNTGGLCGNYSTNPNDDKFTWNCTAAPNGFINGGYSRAPATEVQMSKFWKLDRCAPDELDYKRFGTDTCVCDKNEPADNENCAVPLSICLPSRCGRPVIPSPCNCVHNYNANPCERAVAVAIVDAFFDLFKIILAFAEKLLEEFLFHLLKEWAISDHMATSDEYWALNTCQIGRNWALDTCGDSNKHQLCTEFKIPCKCLISGYRELLNDFGGIQRCPPKDSCPVPTCPLPL